MGQWTGTEGLTIRLRHKGSEASRIQKVSVPVIIYLWLGHRECEVRAGFGLVVLSFGISSAAVLNLYKLQRPV